MPENHKLVFLNVSSFFINIPNDKPLSRNSQSSRCGIMPKYSQNCFTVGYLVMEELGNKVIVNLEYVLHYYKRYLDDSI